MSRFGKTRGLEEFQAAKVIRPLVGAPNYLHCRVSDASTNSPIVHDLKFRHDHSYHPPIPC